MSRVYEFAVNHSASKGLSNGSSKKMIMDDNNLREVFLQRIMKDKKNVEIGLLC